MTNNLELNEGSEIVQNEQGPNVNAELANNDVPSSGGRKLRLSMIAKEIRAFQASNDDTNVKVAFKIREARTHFDKDAKGKKTWAKWVEQNLPMKVSWANQLLQVANHPIPIEKLLEIREQSKARTKEHREKKKQTESPLRNGHPDTAPEPDATDSELEPERIALIKFAKFGPIIDVIRILGEACPGWAVSNEVSGGPVSPDENQVDSLSEFAGLCAVGDSEPAPTHSQGDAP